MTVGMAAGEVVLVGAHETEVSKTARGSKLVLRCIVSVYNAVSVKGKLERMGWCETTRPKKHLIYIYFRPTAPAYMTDVDVHHGSQSWLGVMLVKI